MKNKRNSKLQSSKCTDRCNKKGAGSRLTLETEQVQNRVTKKQTSSKFTVARENSQGHDRGGGRQ